MSTEGLNKPEQKREIPLEWFIGTGNKTRGIGVISFSAEFLKLGDGRIGTYLQLEDEENIKAITGFTLEELNSKKNELEAEYRGKKEAPFLFKLF